MRFMAHFARAGHILVETVTMFLFWLPAASDVCLYNAVQSQKAVSA